VMGLDIISEVIAEGGLFVFENLIVDVDEAEEKIEDWAYKVLDWVRLAAAAGAWDKIMERAEDIITAFLVLVKEEHRGIVLQTLRSVISDARR